MNKLMEDTIIMERNKFKAAYPDPFFTRDQMRSGGFIVYLIGKLLLILVKLIIQFPYRA